MRKLFVQHLFHKTQTHSKMYKLPKILLISIVIYFYYIIYTEIVKVGISEIKTQEESNKNYIKDSLNPKEHYLYLKSEKNKKTTYSDIKKLMSKDISNGKYLISLINTYEYKEKTPEIIELSKKLWPAYTEIRFSSANYWIKEEKIDKLVEEWNVILTRTSSSKVREEIFKALISISLDERNQKYLTNYALSPPKWWIRFFQSLSDQKQSTYLLNHFYSIRKKSRIPITKRERDIFVDNLIKKNYWSHAYLIWLSGLSEKKLSLIKNHIYDGGFDDRYKHQIYSWRKTFGWRFTPNKNIITSIENSYEIKKRKALHIHIRKRKPFSFFHVEQIIKIKPGKYKISYLAKTNNLNASTGLEWRVRCLEDSRKILGKSKAYKKNQKWTEDSFQINIPEKCSTIILRLESSSSKKHKQVYLGHLWFDDFKISKGDQ